MGEEEEMTRHRLMSIYTLRLTNLYVGGIHCDPSFLTFGQWDIQWRSGQGTKVTSWASPGVLSRQTPFPCWLATASNEQAKSRFDAGKRRKRRPVLPPPHVACPFKC